MLKNMWRWTMGNADRLVGVTIIFAMVGGMAYCLHRLATGTPTANEALLLSAMLTLCSVLGSWIASKYYSESSFDKSQRLFALKASEKVLNLSKELNRLSTSLQDELKPDEYANPHEEILAKNMVIESAIYAVQTLKSMNDGSLSDWQGVIGDEINARREDQEEREATLRELMERLEDLPTQAPSDDQEGQEPQVERAERLQMQVNSLRDDLQILAGQISGIPVRRVTKLSSKRERVEHACPKCGSLVVYKQKSKLGGIKAVNCPTCGAKLYSERLDTDFRVLERTPIQEKVTCPGCLSLFTVELDPVPGSKQESNCTSCGVQVRFTRRASDVRVDLVNQDNTLASGSPATLNEEFLASVKSAMGEQPWPRGRAHEAAKRLRVSHNEMNQALQELITRGEFKVQINGKLFVPDDPSRSRG